MANEPFRPDLAQGQTISNTQLMRIFRCACEGGIRPSNRTNTITLVLNHTKHPHADDWHGNVVDFRGSGAIGEQRMDRGRNRTLLNAFKNGARPVFLFEVYKPGKYTYRGQVRLAGHPFRRTERDAEGRKRNVWIFPLELIGGQPAGAEAQGQEAAGAAAAGTAAEKSV